MDRRKFFWNLGAGAAWLAGGASAPRRVRGRMPTGKHKPNLLFVFADQMRAQATGYGGDSNVRTPYLDSLARESINFTHAVSGCPVCSPYRASLMTGRHPLSHGVFLNDLYLDSEAVSIAEALNDAGYSTAYIGKWHLDGHGRSNFTPPERRQGFQFWKALECTHDYHRSHYYADDPTKRTWEGYDAAAQTHEATQYIREHASSNRPFALFLSWGPPHNPYGTAPEPYRSLYQPEAVVLRPNVPERCAEWARRDLAGYYGHISALDACVGELLDSLDQLNLAERTLFVFTSDHGDMLGSHGEQRKQRPWDESIRVPFLLRYPALHGRKGGSRDALLDAPDIMPTLLGLCGVSCPDTVEGKDFSRYLMGGPPPSGADAALIACYAPFGEWTRAQGGREYRGVRTRRYTYVRAIDGPWLLYDNKKDPYQLENVCGRPGYATVQARLESVLQQKLEEQRDEFLPAEEYIRKWGYSVDESGTVPYEP